MWVKYYLHKRRIKNLKYKWLWLLKKASVFNIWERYVSWDSDSAWYDLYRLEAKDEDENIYESENFKDADNWWRTLEEMVVKYDGVVYDLWNKDVAIRQINNNIQRLEGELSKNPWFFKKIEIKKDI